MSVDKTIINPPAPVERIVPVYIEDEMKTSYIDYAMSVIIGRALPDVRDGLKPVHRRILYAMYDLNNVHNKPHKKSARIVGEVLGKYHPHGDTAVYDAIVRMAQDFSQRYPLIDGHGNFGSIDGDSAAAMRYTEARLQSYSEEMLDDIEKKTISFSPNFDGTLEEPIVLPAKIPNLLVNGSSGIAVGMATNIPPHNLKEVVGAIIALIENPEITVDELVADHVKGPDFPTGAYITNRKEMAEIYKTGRGRVIMRSVVDIETDEKKNKNFIIISEIPYQVNKAKLVEDIADLINEKKVEGVSDIRDESNREGIRVVIELKRGEEPDLILNHLYKHTNLQTSFGVIMLAIVDQKPRVLNLKEILNLFLSHRFEVITNRTKFELKKAEDRMHILEGLRIAIENIDDVIAIIKASKNAEEAKLALISNFDFSDLQAQSIVDMRLRALTGLEIEKIENEYQELMKRIADLRAILADSKLVYDIIKKELIEIREKYGDERRSKFLDKIDEITKEDLVKEENVMVIITHSGYIKRMPSEIYRSQNRGGKGSTIGKMIDEDFAERIYVASSKDYLFFFTNFGKAYSIKVYEIPEATKQSRGRLLSNIIKLEQNEKISAIVPVSSFDETTYFAFVTKYGQVKKTPLIDYKNSVSRGIIAIKLDENDELVKVCMTNGNCDLMICTRFGQAVWFSEKQVRGMGRSTRGVRGVNLKDADFVIDMETVNESSTILTVTENGYGKRTPVAKYRKTRRGSSGVINIKIVEDNGPVVGMLETTTGEEGDIVLLTQTGMIIRTSVAAISETGRNTIGRILIRLNANDKVIGISHVEKEVNKETIYKTSSSTGEGEEIIDDDAPVDDIVEDDVLEDEEPKAGK
ncbi:MAG: DNA gyrase subunit A [bacterium ADurb.Bin243]|nr:MAG: DNA gyrase subunit A [bacterium ADurb.Bin243]HOD40259.1 DNA gyrase subunit A [Candidatus Wallbacteria bacterium]